MSGQPRAGLNVDALTRAGELQLDVYVVTLSSPAMTDETLRNLLNTASDKWGGGWEAWGHGGGRPLRAAKAESAGRRLFACVMLLQQAGVSLCRAAHRAVLSSCSVWQRDERGTWC